MGNTKKYLPLLMGVAVAAGILLGSKLNFGDGNEKIFATNSKKDKLNRLIDYIDYEYVERRVARSEITKRHVAVAGEQIVNRRRTARAEHDSESVSQI